MMMAKEVSRQLAQRAEDIARYLLPNGKKSGSEWRVGSIDGESGESLGVHLTGEKSGVWSDLRRWIEWPFIGSLGGDTRSFNPCRSD